MTQPLNPSRRRWLLATAAGAAAGLAGCGGGLDDDVRLRAVNATADVSAIDVDYNDWSFAQDVRQGGEASRYDERGLLVIGGFGEFEVFRTSNSRRLYNVARSLPQADSASVVVMGFGNDLRLRLIDEDADRPSDSASVRLRVLHALPDLGPLDVHLTAADTPLAGRAAEWSLDGYDSLSVFVQRPVGSRLRVTPRGNPSAVLFDSRSASLPGGTVATLVLAPAVARDRIAVAVLPQGETARVLVDS
jgi:Domain of unknown function (DUF4397)